MTVSMPLVALLGAGAYIAWRFMGLRVWHAVLCLLFGFVHRRRTVTGLISEYRRAA
jgi:hypothetical protein